MDNLLIDFETYFDAEYTLKKLSTSEYVRDARFKIHGAAVRATSWARSQWLREPALRDFLADVDWSKTRLIAHHAQFDGFILRETYGHTAAESFCTRDAARYVFQGLVHGYELDTLAQALNLERKLKTLQEFKGIRELSDEQHKRMGEYACRDGDIEWQLLDILWAATPKFERQLMSLTHRMFCAPVLRVDVERAKAAAVAEKIHNEAVIAASGLSVKALRSDTQFSDALRAYDVEIKTKVTPKGKTKPAFAKSDQFMKELLLSEFEWVRKAADARIVAKATSQGLRAQRLINAGTTGDGTLPVYYSYHGAGTGRWSGGNKMNLQNLTAGGELRKSIIAPPGYVLGVADSGQIECRKNAWFWDETDLLDAFRTGRDTYCELASGFYGRRITKADAVERFVGKTCELGLGFHMGWRKLQATLLRGDRGSPIVRLSDAEAQHIVYNVYRANRRKIVAGWDVCKGMIEFLAFGQGRRTFGKLEVDATTSTVYLPSGRPLIYPCMQQDDESNYFYVDNGDPVWIHPGGMDENVVQASSRDVIGEQMLAIDERYRVVMMTHDEIVALIPEQEAQEGWEWMRDQMLIAPQWCSDLPLKAEGGYAREYSK